MGNEGEIDKMASGDISCVGQEERVRGRKRCGVFKDTNRDLSWREMAGVEIRSSRR